MRTAWHEGNRVRLLENGEAFFPRVFEAIRAAKHEVLVETFILFEDAVGEGLRDALAQAGRAGVAVDLTVDGYGSPQFSPAFLAVLREAGVRMRVFDPRRPLLGLRTNLFRRLHRKIVVVDGERAFVGGINFSADHLADFGPQAKQDYSIEIEGPAVADIRRAGRALIDAAPRRWRRSAPMPGRRPPDPAPVARGPARVAFVTRDNTEHTDDIEHHYRLAIRAARRRIVIANAYFLPGYRLLKALRDAARRGVDVLLILQGHPDMPMVTAATRSLYRYLIPAGVRIVEYCRRPFHGKVALVDDGWATVGSSNLDPLSLWMNLEANVLVHDTAFTAGLHAHLERLAREECTPVDAAGWLQGGVLRPVFGVVLFHLLRHFPRLAGLLPAHAPRISEVRAAVPDDMPAGTPVPVFDVTADAAAPAEPARPETRELAGGKRRRA
ncbi:cardiolipin synthase ClsB [Dokdonella koreensis]|uniref:Cardiolipin synthase B n=1 Tax=Dokdonella koreensis DS-123 TaxID=1300342 RepID=A0A160DU00_9GAMM|nr:cardiolipin synthase ClsB [Dokdonella koreensis]ANB17481.1 Cardiolipin synthetase [Dokdonella koreensis DS-123]